jgi:hypothetical protein
VVHSQEIAHGPLVKADRKTGNLYKWAFEPEKRKRKRKPKPIIKPRAPAFGP